MPLIGPPAIREIARDAKGGQQRFACQKDGVLASSAYRGQHRARVVINRVPSPARIGFAVHGAPPLVKFRAEPATHLQRIRTPYLYLTRARGAGAATPPDSLAREQAPFFSSLMTAVGLMCSTRAVSRMPLAFMARSKIWCFTAGDWPA